MLGFGRSRREKGAVIHIDAFWQVWLNVKNWKGRPCPLTFDPRKRGSVTNKNEGNPFHYHGGGIWRLYVHRCT